MRGRVTGAGLRVTGTAKGRVPGAGFRVPGTTQDRVTGDGLRVTGTTVDDVRLDTSSSPSLPSPALGVAVHEFLGLRIGEYDIDCLTDRVAKAIAENEHIVVANHNLHSVYLCSRDAKLRAFHAAADVTHADGMSIIALARLLGLPLRRVHRVTYVDWIGPLMHEAATRGWRVFSLGGRPGVFEQAAAHLRSDHPGLEIAGAHGYFNQSAGSSESAAALAQITAFDPNVLLVGMGMPRQEHWVHDHRAKIRANATLMAGAAMDYVAGVVPTPPRGAAAAGFEWAWRLAAEPTRLWRRYLVEPWHVLAMVMAARAGRRSGGRR